MSSNNDHNMWDWQGQDYSLEDNTNTEISESNLKGGSRNRDHRSYTFDDDTTTPIKACGDLPYHATNNEVKGKGVEHYVEPSSQVKRRRTLQFENEVFDAPLCNDEMALRSEETSDSLEDAISEMSKWVADFADDTPASSNDYLDPSAEGWISDCFNDPEMQLISEDGVNQAPDVPVNNTEVCHTNPRHSAIPLTKLPVHTRQNVTLRGKKSYMRAPPKLASSVVYPFTFIKPCSVHGDMTLKDINQRILTPPKPKQDEEDPSGSIQTSAFSGKPVVGKTRIRTEGGEGSITILRTKG